MFGCLMVYGALFGTGSLIYGHTTTAAFWITVFVVSAGVLLRIVPKMWSGDSATG